MTTKVATTKTTELALINATELLGDSYTTGFENVTQSDLSIQFLSIIQGLSPQLKRVSPKYIEGAIEGDIYNNGTNKVVKELTIIPCGFRQAINEWKPRTAGGGYVKEWPINQDIPGSYHIDDNGRKIRKLGDNILVDTKYHAVLIVDGDSTYKAMLPMTSSQMKKSKQWLSQMLAIKSSGKPLPSWVQVYKLTTVPESNASGDYYNWSITHTKNLLNFDLANGVLTPVVSASDAELFKEAKSFAEALQKQPDLYTSAKPPTDADDTPEDTIATVLRDDKAPM